MDYCMYNLQDQGPYPYCESIPYVANMNQNYRATLWTGSYLQMTVMSILPFDDIGLEMHPETDQFIRVESGEAVVQMGSQKECMNYQQKLGVGCGIFVPKGTWHNVTNIGQCELKVSTIYAPPHHPHGTIHQTKCDSKKEYKK